MSVELPDHIRELLDRCNSDDSVERFEAFEEIWDYALNQGSPGEHAVAIFAEFLKMVAHRHPDWGDILVGVYLSALDLAEGPSRVGDANIRRTVTLQAILRARGIFEAICGEPCVPDTGDCRTHRAAVELLRLASSGPAVGLSHLIISLIRERPDEHANLWATLDYPGFLAGLSDEDLHLCAEQREVDAVQRLASFLLASRGSPIWRLWPDRQRGF